MVQNIEHKRPHQRLRNTGSGFFKRDVRLKKNISET